jgi:hypothetical protein
MHLRKQAGKDTIVLQRRAQPGDGLR